MGSSSSAHVSSSGAWGGTRSPGSQNHQALRPATTTVPPWDPRHRWPPRPACGPQKARRRCTMSLHWRLLQVPPLPRLPGPTAATRTACLAPPSPTTRSGMKTAGLSSDSIARPPAACPPRTAHGSAARIRVARIPGWVRRPGKVQGQATQKYSRSEHHRPTRTWLTSTLHHPALARSAPCHCPLGSTRICRRSRR